MCVGVCAHGSVCVRVCARECVPVPVHVRPCVFADSISRGASSVLQVGFSMMENKGANSRSDSLSRLLSVTQVVIDLTGGV